MWVKQSKKAGWCPGAKIANSAGLEDWEEEEDWEEAMEEADASRQPGL